MSDEFYCTMLMLCIILYVFIKLNKRMDKIEKCHNQLQKLVFKIQDKVVDNILDKYLDQSKGLECDNAKHFSIDGKDIPIIGEDITEVIKAKNVEVIKK